MPEVNRVPFRYEPVNGDLFLDHFRQMFYMDRLEDVRDVLQHATMEHGVVREIEGELWFSDAEDEPPRVRDLRYASPTVRREHDLPIDGPIVLDAD